MSNELANALRFNGRVQDYERFRMRYPVDVLDVIREHCGLTPKYQVADIGAGTGMLAELFLDFGCPVTAVEPNAEMRAACQPLPHRFRTMQMVDATAEATTLAIASFDLVCVGCAFHWFDADRALSEFRRILRPGRWVTLVSNRRAQLGSEAATDYEQILMQHAIDYSALRGGYRRFETLDPFPGQSTFRHTIHGSEALSLEAFLGQTQSLSVAPMPGHSNYPAMQAALHNYFARWSSNGTLQLETVCEVIGWQTP
jgi:SAM-dependent methyltransferase